MTTLFDYKNSTEKEQDALWVCDFTEKLHKSKKKSIIGLRLSVIFFRLSEFSFNINILTKWFLYEGRKVWGGAQLGPVLTCCTRTHTHTHAHTHSNIQTSFLSRALSPHTWRGLLWVSHMSKYKLRVSYRTELHIWFESVCPVCFEKDHFASTQSFSTDSNPRTRWA